MKVLKKREFRNLCEKFRKEIDLYKLILKHRRTPWLARAFLGLAVIYILLPFDIIPDFIPLIGQIDDLLIVPALLYIALRIVPREVIEDCRKMIYAKKGEDYEIF
jgi:uncharacterized membrane protein YkvA (DUF1232 family)